MPIRSPSLVELHAFLAVARAGSFRQAAEALCVTQAAVSRAVLRLEAELGQDVFQRAPGGVRLTPAGERLRGLVEKPVAALEDAATAMRQQPERLKLRLSVITSLGSLWLMPRLEDFHRAHPEVELEFRQYHHDEDFLRDDVDLWIENRRTAQEPWPRQVAARYLIGREIVAVCAPRLAADVRTAQQLVQLPLLYHSNYPHNWDLWAKAQEVALPARRRGTGFDLVLNLLEAARAGMGVAVVQQCMVEADLASGRLAMPVAGAANTGRGYFLCRRRSQPAHPAAELFSQWVAAAALSARASPAARPARH
ncbi:MAG: LysR substrate-binding domain-containing protein [Pseudomonadota bacterium]